MKTHHAERDDYTAPRLIGVRRWSESVSQWMERSGGPHGASDQRGHRHLQPTPPPPKSTVVPPRKPVPPKKVSAPAKLPYERTAEESRAIKDAEVKKFFAKREPEKKKPLTEDDKKWLTTLQKPEPKRKSDYERIKRSSSLRLASHAQDGKRRSGKIS